MAVSGTDLLWGCPQMNFKANPPFNEMSQGFAAFKKETRMAQYLPELLRTYEFCCYYVKFGLEFKKKARRVIVV